MLKIPLGYFDAKEAERIVRLNLQDVGRRIAFFDFKEAEQKSEDELKLWLSFFSKPRTIASDLPTNFWNGAILAIKSVLNQRGISPQYNIEELFDATCESCKKAKGNRYTFYFGDCRRVPPSSALVRREYIITVRGKSIVSICDDCLPNKRISFDVAVISALVSGIIFFIDAPILVRIFLGFIPFFFSVLYYCKIGLVSKDKLGSIKAISLYEEELAKDGMERCWEEFPRFS
jgi:hypothetical protein